MSKRQNPDILALKQAIIALEQSCPRMRRATIIWLWDTYVIHADKAPAQTKVCDHAEEKK